MNEKEARKLVAEYYMVVRRLGPAIAPLDESEGGWYREKELNEQLISALTSAEDKPKSAVMTNKELNDLLWLATTPSSGLEYATANRIKASHERLRELLDRAIQEVCTEAERIEIEQIIQEQA